MTKKPPAKRIAVAPLPKISKDDLRAQVTKLELTVTTLRAKNREANRAAKMMAAKIDELEEHAAQLEKKLASQATSATRSAKAPRVKRASRDIDPGDAVPPGVAVEDPAPMDEEAETAFENLESNLHS
ncbi:hypothetical protein [Acidisoma cladoniae]|uniref:hypothetical protein n=1 Tax=Acidisoma cladoniae TaxID=3040935 RepID=UPI00254C006C|nr:hypothetical protein [Acidisoma sp. PAMC 29798]